MAFALPVVYASILVFVLLHMHSAALRHAAGVYYNVYLWMQTEWLYSIRTMPLLANLQESAGTQLQWHAFQVVQMGPKRKIVTYDPTIKKRVRRQV